jgi:hypothetical protein
MFRSDSPLRRRLPRRGGFEREPYGAKTGAADHGSRARRLNASFVSSRAQQRIRNSFGRPLAKVGGPHLIHPPSHAQFGIYLTRNQCPAADTNAHRNADQVSGNAPKQVRAMPRPERATPPFVTSDWLSLNRFSRAVLTAMARAVMTDNLRASAPSGLNLQPNKSA